MEMNNKQADVIMRPAGKTGCDFGFLLQFRYRMWRKSWETAGFFRPIKKAEKKMKKVLAFFGNLL